MKYVALALVTLLPALAHADSYPTTLSHEEQERHEFLDARANRSGGPERSFGSLPDMPQAHRQSSLEPGTRRHHHPTHGVSSPHLRASR